MINLNRIAIISDLHLDDWCRGNRKAITHTYNQLLENAQQCQPDLIVVAGDLFNGAGCEIVRSQISHTDVIFVPGNHDHYHLQLPNQPQWEIIDDNQIFVSTLWTNFAGGTGFEWQIYSQIADSRYIGATSWSKIQNYCNLTKQMIWKTNPEIVITHFPPSNQSVAPWFKGNFYNPFFVNDFDSDFDQIDTKLWIFGHVHHRHSYYINDCLCVCNPLGYVRENYKSIDDYRPMVVERIENGWKVV